MREPFSVWKKIRIKMKRVSSFYWAFSRTFSMNFCSPRSSLIFFVLSGHCLTPPCPNPIFPYFRQREKKKMLRQPILSLFLFLHKKRRISSILQTNSPPKRDLLLLFGKGNKNSKYTQTLRPCLQSTWGHGCGYWINVCSNAVWQSNEIMSAARLQKGGENWVPIKEGHKLQTEILVYCTWQEPGERIWNWEFRLNRAKDKNVRIAVFIMLQ